MTVFLALSAEMLVAGDLPEPAHPAMQAQNAHTTLA